MEKVVLNKVIQWLKDEISFKSIPRVGLNDDSNFKEIHNDGAIDGKIECAEGLLEMIDKWKEEEKNKPRKTMTMADITEERRKNPEKYLSQYTIDEMKKLGLPIGRNK